MQPPRDSRKKSGHSRGEGQSGHRHNRGERRKRRKAPSRQIKVIGLIGGIGSGKSYVASKLAERGATVIDADSVGHALLDQGPVQEVLVRRFGVDILGISDEDGQRKIDRRLLGAIVFKDEAALKLLEETLHPRMRATFERVISRLSRQLFPKPGALRLPAPVVVLDAAVLYEAGWDDLCDQVVFVEAPRKDRLRRLKEQRDWSQEELDQRESAQWPLDLKKNQADVVLKNPDAEDTTALDNEIDKLWGRISPLAPPPKPVKSDASPDYRHLIEDEIDVIATDRPKKRKSGGRSKP